jgi:CHAT domain-containing protein
LPTLRDRRFVLTPSIAAHLRCQRIEPVDPRRVVAVSGPGLTLAEDEVRQVIDAHGGGEWLTGGDADAGHVRDLIAGAEIAHIVCHGRFVFESPMFSSLELHGGPMFVHEFERLRPCPRVTVLSACHAGSHTSPSEREILGLSASLVAAGARSVVAATFAVPDSSATVAMMRAVHERLASGSDVAEALRSARAIDPLVGGAFVCHGAAWE